MPGWLGIGHAFRMRREPQDGQQLQDDAGPHPDVIARLLLERYSIRAGERVRVDVNPERMAMTVVLSDDKHRISLTVAYLRGSDQADPWMRVADAVDALFGMLVESDRDYRALPDGADVEHGGAFFHVHVEHEIPQLERLADQILSLGKPSS